jgi:hypothetical protein
MKNTAIESMRIWFAPIIIFAIAGHAEIARSNSAERSGGIQFT